MRHPHYIIRDRYSAYGDAFIRRLTAMDIRDRPISARSLWQNGHAERLVGLIRRDCLDHAVVFAEEYVRHLLSSYRQFYYEFRMQLSLKKDAPPSRGTQSTGDVLPRQSWADYVINMSEFDFSRRTTEHPLLCRRGRDDPDQIRHATSFLAVRTGIPSTLQ